MQKLVIGSAQIGSHYGISNTVGITKDSDLRKIISYMSMNKINYFDSAPAYGSAEARLGLACDNYDTFKFQSKVSLPQKQISKAQLFRYLDETLDTTLRNLRSQKLSVLFSHSPKDLRSYHKDNFADWMISQVKNGNIDMLGVSLYEREDFPANLAHLFHIVQLPLSVFNQEHYLSGFVEDLCHRDILVQARSIFCQGIVLQNNEELPSFLSKNLKLHVQLWSQYLSSHNISPLHAALDFVKQIKQIDSIVVGVDDFEQLQQIHSAFTTNSINYERPFSSWSYNNSEELDPRFWIRP